MASTVVRVPSSFGTFLGKGSSFASVGRASFFGSSGKVVFLTYSALSLIFSAVLSGVVVDCLWVR